MAGEDWNGDGREPMVSGRDGSKGRLLVRC
jgi:hypothetical protein